MKNSYLKLPLLIISLMAFTGCNKSDESSFIVDLLKEGDNYKIEEFTNAYSRYIEDVHFFEDVTLTVKNYAPHDVFDTYGVGIYQVLTKGETINDLDTYMYYNKTIYLISTHLVKNQVNELSSMVFTDVNKDGSFEITTAYNVTADFRSLSNITTLDTFSLSCVYGRIEETVYFKKNNKGVGFYSKTSKKHLGNIEKYDRYYEFSLPRYELECPSYKIVVTYDKNNSNVPVKYPGSSHSLKVNFELTYLGEDITITNTNLPYGPQIEFSNGDVKLNVANPYAVVDGTITIKKDQVFKSTSQILDYYDKENPKGTYDMKISFFDKETVSEEKALIAK